MKNERERSYLPNKGFQTSQAPTTAVHLQSSTTSDSFHLLDAMERKLFMALLDRYKPVRGKDWVGEGCRQLSPEEADAYRARVAAERAAAEARPGKKVSRSQDFVQGAFFEELEKDMERQGVRNCKEVVAELKEVYVHWLCSLNLEELERILAN